MKKERYEAPVIEIVEFEAEDILTQSVMTILTLAIMK